MDVISNSWANRCCCFSNLHQGMMWSTSLTFCCTKGRSFFPALGMFELPHWFAYHHWYAKKKITLPFHELQYYGFISVLNVLCERQSAITLSVNLFTFEGGWGVDTLWSSTVNSTKEQLNGWRRIQSWGAILSINLLCGIKTQKKHRRGLRHMHRHARAPR